MTDLYLGRAYPAGGLVPGAPRPPSPDLPGEYRISCPANPVPSAESGSPSGPQSHGQELAAYLIPLLQALSEQTAAINRLASSNESLSRAVSSLIDEMANADEEDSDGEPRTYLDGSRVR